MADEKYPEHAKLQAVKDQSQAIGEFLDVGLPSMGIHLCEADDERGRFFPTHRSVQSLLAEYFEIDLKRLDQEKEQMLDEMRAMNASRS